MGSASWATLCDLAARWVDAMRHATKQVREEVLESRTLIAEAAAGLTVDPERPYARYVLHASEQGEAMLAKWTRRMPCAPHDHDEAQGVVFVDGGNFQEFRYRITAHGFELAETIDAGPGELLPVDTDTVHAMVCDDEGHSLHLYVPPIRYMCVFDLHARIRYRLRPGAGAWLPPDPSMIEAREPWG